jgi:hypothetical protein
MAKYEGTLKSVQQHQLPQWFDDAKQDLINTCLVIDEEVLDKKGAMVSEVLFRKDTERRIINMDELTTT